MLALTRNNILQLVVVFCPEHAHESIRLYRNICDMAHRMPLSRYAFVRVVSLHH